MSSLNSVGDPEVCECEAIGLASVSMSILPRSQLELP